MAIFSKKGFFENEIQLRKSLIYPPYCDIISVSFVSDNENTAAMCAKALGDKKSELKIRAIENGTVIDHITANKSLHILKILGLPDSETKNVTVAMNVSSKEIGRKDIVKIENRELNHEELDQIALIAPKASVNIIRDYKPVKKDKIILPNTITGIIKCTNSKCITNYANEPIAPKFNVINNHPPVVRCHYCEKLIKTEDIEKQFE